MNEQYEQLYKEMIEEINWCQQVQMSEPEVVTSCFWIAKNYWDKLKKLIKENPLKNEVQEINFFKDLKPKFTAEIQYFAILSEALLFVPTDKEDQLCFWQREADRYQWFCDKNREFTDYYESGADHLDSIFFTKMNINVAPLQPLVSYDSDREFCSGQDHLVRSLLAHKMYWRYCREKLEMLTDTKNRAL